MSSSDTPHVFNKSLRPVLLAAALLPLLAACTTNPFTGERQVSNTARYAAIGGAVCGLVGAIEDSQRARNAALGCGAIGAGIGAYMDVQEAELREQLQGTGVQVQRNADDTLTLIMPGNVTFPTNGYVILDNFYPVLHSVAEVLYKYRDTSLRVIGHTDSTGSAEYNYGLSNRRAESVANYFAEVGIDQGRLITRGMGPDEPIASNDTASGRSLNRRVELSIVADPS